jgi:hypothetical protein
MHCNFYHYKLSFICSNIPFHEIYIFYITTATLALPFCLHNKYSFFFAIYDFSFKLHLSR